MPANFILLKKTPKKLNLHRCDANYDTRLATLSGSDDEAEISCNVTLGDESALDTASHCCARLHLIKEARHGEACKSVLNCAPNHKMFCRDERCDCGGVEPVWEGDYWCPAEERGQSCQVDAQCRAFDSNAACIRENPDDRSVRDPEMHSEMSGLSNMVCECPHGENNVTLMCNVAERRAFSSLLLSLLATAASLFLLVN